MIDDLRALGWLRWRQFRDDLRYFLRLLGYESGNRGYALYLIAILAFWVFAMSAYTIDQAVLFGRLLEPESYGDIADGLAWAIFLGQAYVLANALRSTPLKLSFADMAFIAPTTINPAAPVLLGMFRQVMTRLVILGPLAALLAVMLASVLRFDPLTDNLPVAGRALVGAVPVIVLTWAGAWLLGVLRLASPALRQSRALWLVVLAWLALGWLLPDVAHVGGGVLVSALYGDLPGWVLPALWGACLAVIAGVTVAGQGINMTHAVDESQTYARIQALGLLAYRQFDLVMSIRMQGSQTGRRPRFRLSPTVSGWNAIAQRAALLYVRHPLLLITAMIWTVALTAGAKLVVDSGFALPLTIGWVLITGFASPTGLHYVFRTDQEERFLRQLLPVEGIGLLMADTLVPFVAMFFTGLLTWAWLSPDVPELIAVMLALPFWLTIQTLCGALAITRPNRTLQIRLLTVCASYLTIAVGFAVLGAVGATFAATFVILTLAGLVSAWA